MDAILIKGFKQQSCHMLIVEQPANLCQTRRVAPVELSLGAFHHTRLTGQRPLGVARPRKKERQFPIKPGQPTDNQVFDKLPSNPGCILTESEISTQI